MSLQESLDKFEEAEQELLTVVSELFPFESVATCGSHSGQFVIVMKPYDVQAGYVRCLLESDATVEWPAISLQPRPSRKEWPSWVKKRLSQRKSARTRRANEYGRVTGELR